MPRVEFIDTSLRDGHQSLLATRMSTEQCLRVLPLLKDSGYRILELWGGATLDAALRFTGDDPFDRLDRFRSLLGPAPEKHAARPLRSGGLPLGQPGSGIQIRSLCRGQNLFGYTPYADQIVYSFIKEAVRSGNDRVRVFDALNDPRNLQTAVMAVKTFDGTAEPALSYTTSPVHDTDHFLRFAARVVDNGADALAIKDMAGLLHPADCFTLVDGLRAKFPDLDLSIHSHGTNGLATASYVAAMLAGVDRFDTAHGPMANSTSQPSVELLAWFARAAGYEHNVDLKHQREIDARLRKIREELKNVDAHPDRFGEPWPDEPSPEVARKIERALELIASRDRDRINQAVAIIEDEILVPQGFPAVDRTQLDAQIPGGMISNLHNQMKEQGQLDKLPAILEEVPRVRAEAGYIPLVTPTSQIVGTQAAMNVLTGNRYSMITNEFKAIILGKYGRTPAAPDPDLVKKCAPDGKLFDRRPGDYAPEPDLKKVAADLGPHASAQRNQLLYLLFPGPTKKFLETRTPAAVAAA